MAKMVFEKKEEKLLDYYVSKKAELINNKDTFKNLLIEGDNLYSLDYLKQKYTNKIDVIYIDPPYNTKKNFVYKDNKKEDEWLSFMNNRLLSAKELMTDDGIIFISIDDNEQHRLRMLCDEIFGEDNFISDFKWVFSKEEDLSNVISTTGSNIGKIKNSYESLICYGSSKNINFNISKKTLGRSTNKINGENTLYIKKGIRAESCFSKTFKTKVGGKEEPIYILNDDGIIVENGILINDIILRANFRSPNVVEKLNNKEKVFDNKGSEYLELIISNTGQLKILKNQCSTSIPNIISGLGDSSVAKKELSIININFDYAKPTTLIKKIISFIDKKDALILDFFAGSGTTGHAVQQLNKEDGGNRQYILCTNNENNICEEVTYERLKRISNPESYGLDLKKVDKLPHNLLYLKINKKN